MKIDIRHEGVNPRLSCVGVALLRLFVVLGPVLLGLLIALYIGRPSVAFLASGVILAAALLACDGWIVARLDWISGALALTTQSAFLIFIHGYAASPLPAPAAYSGALPKASPPEGMAVR
jgi:hypothetical protein